jgi:hypothetical protein
VLYPTTYADDEFCHRAQVIKPYAFLLKPSTPREIQLAINIALCRHNAERTAHTTLGKAVTECTAELELARRRIANIPGSLQLFGFARSPRTTARYAGIRPGAGFGLTIVVKGA